MRDREQRSTVGQMRVERGERGGQGKWVKSAMWLVGTQLSSEKVSRRTRRGDLFMQGLIIGSGALVLLTLAWVHLGLSAIIFPPAATPAHLVAATGSYTVTLYADSGQLKTGAANVVSFDVRDRAGHPVTNATVRVHAEMTTMPMPVPDALATPQGNNRYGAHLTFSMAGPWRLTVHIIAPAQSDTSVAFDVGVRWR